MKKIILFLITLLVLTGCQEQVRPLSGTYSYKISGRVEADGSEEALANEQGAMELLRISKDSALLTFNVLMGGTYHTEAVVSGKEIELLPFERKISVGLSEYDVTVSGKGSVYDKTILIDLQYKGKDLTTKQIELLCKKN